MQLLRVNQAARELGCSETFLRRAEQTGRIPRARRDMNGWRVYTVDDVVALRRVLLPSTEQLESGRQEQVSSA